MLECIREFTNALTNFHSQVASLVKPVVLSCHSQWFFGTHLSINHELTRTQKSFRSSIVPITFPFLLTHTEPHYTSQVATLAKPVIHKRTHPFYLPSCNSRGNPSRCSIVSLSMIFWHAPSSRMRPGDLPCFHIRPTASSRWWAPRERGLHEYTYKWECCALKNRREPLLWFNFQFEWSLSH